MSARFDVVVLGEVLIELSSTEPFGDGISMRLGFSGDALNSAAAAAAAGARVALLTNVAKDEIGDVLVGRIAELGIDTTLVRRVAGQNGAYFVHADPSGAREFVYARRGSAASQLSAADVHAAGLDTAVVLASGITCALSDSAAGAVRAAAASGARFVYDPNFRPRLTDATTAARRLRQLASHAFLVTPSWPSECGALLGAGSPQHAAESVGAMGAGAVAVTCGADGVWLDDGSSARHVPAVPPPAIVDQTGAGDVFAGTVAARIALGDDLREAAMLGAAASSLALGSPGGCTALPTLDDSRTHLAGVPT
ncbi:MAG TPA: PfkB family carbohydrate kinase [Jatrophihabitantaceae bacterium]|nr:PfkB family carbohydrate kinase [Jatrophihabitantaceae bacterium]